MEALLKGELKIRLLNVLYTERASSIPSAVERVTIYSPLVDLDVVLPLPLSLL